MTQISPLEQRLLRQADLKRRFMEIIQLPVAFHLTSDGLDRIKVPRKELVIYPERQPMCNYYYVVVDPETKQPVKIENIYTDTAGEKHLDSFNVSVTF